MGLAENIKRLRTDHDLTQLEFGRIAGVSDKAVSTWEAGLKEPRMGAVKRIAAHFGLSINQLVDGVLPDAVTTPTLDDFTYAMQNETKDLTDMDKQILLSMAKQLNDARKKQNGETG